MQIILFEFIDIYSSTLDALAQGAIRTLSWPTILYVILGVLFGMSLGLIPGLGGLVGMVLALPLAYSMEPFQAIVFMMAITGGSSQSGAVTTILLGTPGTVPNTATLFDGYPLTQKGRGAEAVAVSAVSSGAGALFGLFVLIISVPILRQIVLLFGPVEKFLVILFGLVIISFFTRGSLLRGMIAALFGMSLGLIGFSEISATPRYSLGITALNDGIHFLPVLLGMFVITQMIDISTKETGIITLEELEIGGSRWRNILTAFRHLTSNGLLFLRSAVIGLIVGIIPGAGGTVANFLAYGQAMQSENDTDSFGEGDIRGVLAPEAANDAKEGGSLIPTLALGIPGSGSMIVLLGAFLVFGINPGPNVIQNHLTLVFGIVSALIISNVLSSIIVLVGVDKLAKISTIDTTYLIPTFVIASTIGAFAANKVFSSIIFVFLFGILGYFMKRYKYTPIAFLLGFILVPIAEQNLFLAVQYAGPDLSYFVTPISALLSLVIVFTILKEIQNYRVHQ